MNMLAVIAVVSVAGLYLGWFFTEHERYALANRWRFLDRKPFNCRPCMTFHLIWMLSGGCAVFLKSLAMFFKAVNCAFIIFYALYISSRSKIEK